jgi:hypothetical protein
MKLQNAIGQVAALLALGLPLNATANADDTACSAPGSGSRRAVAHISSGQPDPGKKLMEAAFNKLPGIIVGRFDSTQTGPLSRLKDNPAAGFVAGRYVAIKLSKETVLYVADNNFAHKSAHDLLVSDASLSPAVPPSSTEDAAWFCLKSDWQEPSFIVANSMKTYWVDLVRAGRPTKGFLAVKVPAGTTVFFGPAAIKASADARREEYRIFIPSLFSIANAEALIAMALDRSIHQTGKPTNPPSEQNEASGSGKRSGLIKPDTVRAISTQAQSAASTVASLRSQLKAATLSNSPQNSNQPSASLAPGLAPDSTAAGRNASGAPATISRQSVRQTLTAAPPLAQNLWNLNSSSCSGPNPSSLTNIGTNPVASAGVPQPPRGPLNPGRLAPGIPVAIDNSGPSAQATVKPSKNIAVPPAAPQSATQQPHHTVSLNLANNSTASSPKTPLPPAPANSGLANQSEQQWTFPKYNGPTLQDGSPVPYGSSVPVPNASEPATWSTEGADGHWVNDGGYSIWVSGGAGGSSNASPAISSGKASLPGQNPAGNGALPPDIKQGLAQLWAPGITPDMRKDALNQIMNDPKAAQYKSAIAQYVKQVDGGISPQPLPTAPGPSPTSNSPAVSPNQPDQATTGNTAAESQGQSLPAGQLMPAANQPQSEFSVNNAPPQNASFGAGSNSSASVTPSDNNGPPVPYSTAIKTNPLAIPDSDAIKDGVYVPGAANPDKTDGKLNEAPNSGSRSSAGEPSGFETEPPSPGNSQTGDDSASKVAVAVPDADTGPSGEGTQDASIDYSKIDAALQGAVQQSDQAMADYNAYAENSGLNASARAQVAANIASAQTIDNLGQQASAAGWNAVANGFTMGLVAGSQIIGNKIQQNLANSQAAQAQGYQGQGGGSRQGASSSGYLVVTYYCGNSIDPRGPHCLHTQSFASQAELQAMINSYHRQRYDVIITSQYSSRTWVPTRQSGPCGGGN